MDAIFLFWFNKPGWILPVTFFAGVMLLIMTQATAFAIATAIVWCASKWGRKTRGKKAR